MDVRVDLSYVNLMWILYGAQPVHLAHLNECEMCVRMAASADRPQKRANEDAFL